MHALHINGMTPPALAVAIALNEKGLAFEIVVHDWADTATALARVADGAVELTNGLEGEFPILVDGDRAVADSLFVLEYLDDRYPEPALRPADAYGQWRLQAFGRFLGERALPAVSILGTSTRFRDVPNPDAALQLVEADLLTLERRNAWREALDGGSGADLAEARRNARLLLDRVEGLAATAGDGLLTAQFTLADIFAFVLVHALVVLESDALAEHPAVGAWYDRVVQRPAVVDALASRPLVFLPGPELSRWG